MRKVFMAFALALCANALFAQTTETVIVDENKHRFITNGFWDNWFVQAGAGAQAYFGDHNKQLVFMNRLTPAYESAAGKWFTPTIGTRLMVHGFSYKGATQNGAHSTGVDVPKPEGYDGWWGLTYQEYPFFNAHVDFMFNLSNIIGGYRENRFWDIQPYVGVGWICTWDEPKNQSVTYAAGIMNSFRLGERFDIYLDVRGGMMADTFEGEIGGRNHEGDMSVTLGLSYNFNKRGFDRSQMIIRETTNEKAIDNLRREIAALEKENASLKERKPEIRTEQVKVIASLFVSFEINKSELSDEARVNLSLLAKSIKDLNNDVVYTISGYADAATGNDQINNRLSKERAQAVYNCLVNEYGVNADQLTVEFHGGVNNMFYDNPRLSRATIISVK